MSELAITLIQTKLAWEAPTDNLARFDDWFAEIGETDLILVPEMFTTGFSMASEKLAETMDGHAVAWMAEKAEEKSAVVCGSVIIEDKGHHFNRLIWMPPDGNLRTYDKRHLFRMGTENEHYTAGESRLTVEWKGFRICPLVCYDLRFPVWSRNDENFDLLIYVANWPAARRHHWQTLLRARAVENLCYVAGLNRLGRDGNGVEYAGDSAVVDFNGETLVDMNGETDAATVTLSLDKLEAWRESFPAWRDRDRFEVYPEFPADQ